MEVQKCGPMHKKGLPASIFITTLFTLFVFLPNMGYLTTPRKSILLVTALAFPVCMMFLMLYTGNIHKWRRIFFIVYAVAFAISFVSMTMGDRGHMWLLDKEILYSEAPMCHIVVPMLILPLAFTKEVIFPGQIGGSLLVVIAVTLIYGRAFCSWGCFYGGQDELFSSLRKKKIWKLGIEKLPPFVRYFPFAMLVFIVLHSFATMSPTYCYWFCPFKTSSEFIEVNSFVRVIQTFIFVILWAGLVIALPLLTKKRTQCSLFCPMGAFFSLTSKVNIFHLRIDKDKCKGCGVCQRVCPTFSITSESASGGKSLMTCTRCGACIDACPHDAVHFATRGVPFNTGAHPIGAAGQKEPGKWKKFARDVWDPGVVFLFGIFSLGTILASSFLMDALSRILRVVGV
ncbi:MAG: 4Fe-4S dicluster domain-containing protein [bacterium]|nr:4Fe-4S dicluster domain-containing protein [bacterium]